MVKVSLAPAACKAVTLSGPAIGLPSTVTVNCASPCQASSESERTSLSDPVPIVPPEIGAGVGAGTGAGTGTGVGVTVPPAPAAPAPQAASKAARLLGWSAR